MGGSGRVLLSHSLGRTGGSEGMVEGVAVVEMRERQYISGERGVPHTETPIVVIKGNVKGFIR